MAEPCPPQHPQPGAPRPILRTVTGVFLTCVLTGIAGIPGGLAWAALAPRAQVMVTGRGAADVVNPETSAFIAADGWFCVVGLAGGLLCGFAAYLVAVRRYGALAAAALIIGGFGASLIAWWVGHSIGLSAFHASLMAGHAGAVLHAPLTLRAHPALASWPFGAALAVVAAEMTAGRRNRPRQHADGADTRWAEASSGLPGTGGGPVGSRGAGRLVGAPSVWWARRPVGGRAGRFAGAPAGPWHAGRSVARRPVPAPRQFAVIVAVAPAPVVRFAFCGTTRNW